MSVHPVRSYVICTTPRSGSTLLCRMLAATGVAGAPDSHFHTPSLTRWLEVYGLSQTAFSTTKEALGAVIAAALERGRGTTGCFGLRLQRGSFDYLQSQLAQLCPDLPSDLARFEVSFGPTAFVHLTRADKLAQAVSRLRAEQSGLWHRHSDGTEMERMAPPGVVAYDRAEIARHLTELESQDEAWRLWFVHQGITPITITYSDLADDPKATLALVLKALGFDPMHADRIDVPTARLADRQSAAWIARYQSETTPPRS